MAKKKKSKNKEANYKKSGSSFVPNGSSYKRMFKEEKGKLKILELKISKKDSVKVKIKIDKKRKRIVLLNPFAVETGRGPGIVHIIDPVSMFYHLHDTLKRAILLKEINKKKKLDIEKFLEKVYNLESKFIKSMYDLDFVFNKNKFEEKVREKLSKAKTDRKSRKSKKSNRR